MLNKENANEKKEETLFVDIERMKKALNSESFILPENLTREEIRDFICSKAKEGNK